MNTIRELLRDADPLRYEAAHAPDQRDFHRQAVLAAASDDRVPAPVGRQSRIVVFAIGALAVIAAFFVGARVWSLFVNDLRVQAAVRFEVKLAEDRPGPGLHQAKVADSDRSVYLHDEVIVTNSDIASARAVQDGPSQYRVDVEFNASGAEKMRAATENHIGKHMAILLDGQVVATPVLRTPIGASARITGNFTRSQAERIANGIRIQ
jgi:hypothetical protein